MRASFLRALVLSTLGLAGCGDSQPAAFAGGAAVSSSPSSGGSGGDSNAGSAGSTAQAGSSGAAAGTGGSSANAGNGGGGAAGGAGMGAPTQPSWPEFCTGLATAPTGDQWQTDRVYYENGKLTYAPDANQNRIPDYSYAGYRYGAEPLPNVPEAMRVAPGEGDDTARIQEALDAVAALEPDAGGIRGAVVLEPGIYEIAGTINVDADGVVLRGSGNGDDPASASISLHKIRQLDPARQC